MPAGSMGEPLVVSWGDAHFYAWNCDGGTLIDLRDYAKGFPPTWETHLREAGVPLPVLDSARASEPVGYAFIVGGEARGA